MSVEGDYSAVADAQLDILENGPDPDLYNSILDNDEAGPSSHPAPTKPVCA